MNKFAEFVATRTGFWVWWLTGGAVVAGFTQLSAHLGWLR